MPNLPLLKTAPATSGRTCKTQPKAVDAETSTPSAAPASPAHTVKTQVDAVAYLCDAGYKVSQPTFNRHVKARLVPREESGLFAKSALLGYAAANLTPNSQEQDSAQAEAVTGKISADTDLKTWQAKRQKLRYEKEQGLLMPRSEHERDLAARALFFKKEVENFIHLYGPGIIHLVGGDESRLADLIAHWEATTADWMNAWAQEREFVVNDDPEQDEAPDEDFGDQDSAEPEKEMP